MRAVAVVALDEVVEASLLLQQVVSRGLGGFLLQRQVNAFVPAVLRRMTGLDTLDLDAQAQPPDGELAQAE